MQRLIVKMSTCGFIVVSANAQNLSSFGRTWIALSNDCLTLNCQCRLIRLLQAEMGRSACAVH